MKNLKIIVLPLLIVGVASSVFASNTAEALFDSKCAMCHMKTKPADKNTVIAPAIMGVMRHMKMTYPQKEEAVKFMVDYVMNPSKDKAICMPQKIARFGIMPSQKESITKDELIKVSNWLFDNFPPANFTGGNGQNKNSSNKMGQNRPTFENFDLNGDGSISRDEFNTFMSTHGH